SIFCAELLNSEPVCDGCGVTAFHPLRTSRLTHLPRLDQFDTTVARGRGHVAIRVGESEEKDAFEVAGRGELQLGVLIETTRREGFELSISRPRVLFKTDPSTGRRVEATQGVR